MSPPIDEVSSMSRALLSMLNTINLWIVAGIGVFMFLVGLGLVLDEQPLLGGSIWAIGIFAIIIATTLVQAIRHILYLVFEMYLESQDVRTG